MMVANRNLLFQGSISKGYVSFREGNTFLGGGFQLFVIFVPIWGKISNLTDIFQMGWNHKTRYFFKWYSFLPFFQGGNNMNIIVTIGMIRFLTLLSNNCQLWCFYSLLFFWYEFYTYFCNYTPGKRLVTYRTLETSGKSSTHRRMMYTPED